MLFKIYADFEAGLKGMQRVDEAIKKKSRAYYF